MFRQLIFGTIFSTILMSGMVVAQQQPTREQKVLQDKLDFAQNREWFYDDLDAAMEEAKTTKRPLMVVFR